jgi:hypothetical protein
MTHSAIVLHNVTPHPPFFVHNERIHPATRLIVCPSVCRLSIAVRGLELREKKVVKTLQEMRYNPILPVVLLSWLHVDDGTFALQFSPRSSIIVPVPVPHQTSLDAAELRSKPVLFREFRAETRGLMPVMSSHLPLIDDLWQQSIDVPRHCLIASVFSTKENDGPHLLTLTFDI